MTQPTLSAFFGKKTTPKRQLEEGDDAAAATKEGQVEGKTDKKGSSATAAVTAAAAATGDGSAGGDGAPPTKKAATLSSAITVSASDLPPTMADHPVLEPLTTGQLDAGWRKMVVAEANKPYFGKLMSFLKQEQASKQTIFPPYPLVLNALTLCRWEDVRVVIIGQDPYHAPGQAHGLAFSVVPPTPPPPSLMNIYKEAAADVGMPKPTHGNLEAWCRQGVLLLNTVLTVRRGQAHSHKGKGWEMFTDAVIRELNAKKTGLVFLLWGRPAQEKCKAINRSKHRMITCTHPSPLSAHNNKTDQSFIGSRCFSKANAALKELGKPEINWNV